MLRVSIKIQKGIFTMQSINLKYDRKQYATTTNKKTILISMIIIILTIAVIFIIASKMCTPNETNTYLNYNNYMRIKNGMSYAEVVEIFDNNQGKLVSTSTYGEYTLSYYDWSDESSFCYVSVGFENGKVCIKSQYGLD